MEGLPVICNQNSKPELYSSNSKILNEGEIVRSIRLILLLVGTPGFLGVQDVLIKNARVFDGERVIPRASVLVRDGKIQQIGTQIHAPRNVRVVDGTRGSLNLCNL